ncbi:MAG: LPS-assembly protein LptD, partial [Betaproteobacteria bacterium]
RIAFNPTLAAPFLAPGYFLTPTLGMRYADYRLTHVAAGQAENQTISLPWLSVDGGMTFDRGVNWFGQALTQTFEPRLFYVNAPFRDQSRVPLFDTGLPDFNSSQIFTENRFSGNDRFGDANQLTVAASSRLVTPNGEELLRATLGQRYYFSDERVGLTPTSVLRTRGQSDILASLGGRLSRDFSFDSAIQYNPQLSRPERYSVAARYAPEIAKVVSASYRFNRDTNLKQVDIAGQWPVAPGWYAMGRWNYSLSESRLLEGIAGLEYNAGCWVFRGAFQRLQAAVQTTSTGIFFQLEFNGFGGLGSDEIVQLLKRSVPGYAITNPTQGALVPPSLQRRLPFEQTF